MNDNLHPKFKQILEPFIIPRCGMCGEPFTIAEIGDRKKNHLDLYDKDTICDICDAFHKADIANYNFEVKHERI